LGDARSSKRSKAKPRASAPTKRAAKPAPISTDSAAIEGDDLTEAVQPADVTSRPKVRWIEGHEPTEVVSPDPAPITTLDAALAEIDRLRAVLNQSRIQTEEFWNARNIKWE
jgi:hypothetical protein